MFESTDHVAGWIEKLIRENRLPTTMETRPSDINELADSLLLLMECIYRITDLWYGASCHMVWLAQQHNIEIPESYDEINEEREQLLNMLEQWSAYLQGIPYKPFPSFRDRGGAGIIKLDPDT